MKNDFVKDSQADHVGVQRSTTLNRRYVKRPVVDFTAREARIATHHADELKKREELAEKINRERLAAIKQRKHGKVMGIKMSTKSVKVTTLPKTAPKAVANTSESPAAKKDAAVSKALKSVAKMNSSEKKHGKGAKSNKNVSREELGANRKISFGRIFLALSCSVAAIAAIVYFVHLNSPDLSAQVIAMQSGIDNSYPAYTPRGFNLTSSLASENHLTLTFTNEDGKSYTISEEKSSWDTKALFSNYVEREFKSYDAIREQGLTIYVSGSNAAWVNTGVRYIITADNGVLTQKQIKAIAVSF